ncbi:MAG: FAD-binding oxidoreductase [Dehalococcoidia bacterium]|nr:FAD-binding oxidoreductase [Dehalococcoidia bacterium]
MATTADIVIIGGGVMGCSILYNLAAMGAKNLVLLERDTLGSGSTGKSQAICRMHYSNPVTTLMAWESMKIYRSFPEVVGAEAGYVTTGYLVVVGPQDREAIEQNVAMQQELGIDTRLVTAGDVAEIAPMLSVQDAGGMAYEPQSGYADPHSVTSGYAAMARELGAKVILSSPVRSIETSGDRVTAVVSDQERIETDTVVVAAGPWARSLVSPLGIELPLDTVRHQLLIMRRPAGRIPQHPGVGDIAQEFSFRPDSTHLTLVGGREDPADPDTYNQGVDLDMVEEYTTKLVHRMPAMSEGGFQDGWSGLFTITPDWHPILDRVNGVSGLYCAVGFSGHGFKLAAMIGISMAELVLEGKAKAVDIRPLRFSRFEEADLMRSRYRYNVLA